MEFYDIGLTSPWLSQKAESLGWKKASVCAKLPLSKKEDFKRLLSNRSLLSVSSASGESLRRAATQFSGALLLDCFSTPDFHKDDGLIRTVGKAAQDGKPIAFELPYAYLLRHSFVYRARFLAQTGIFVRKCLKLKAPFVITSQAKEEFELKSPREAAAMATLYGLSIEQARAAMAAAPKKLLEAAKTNSASGEGSVL